MLNWLFNLISPLNDGIYILLLIVLLLIGFYGLIKGADLFVDSASNLAKILKVPALIIGLTIVAFGTSAPEASVSITSSITHNTDLSIGNIIGSNIFNLLCVLGFSCLFAPIIIEKKLIIKDLIFMILGPLLLILFAILPPQNMLISQIEAGVIFAIFLIYLIYTIVSSMKNAKKKSENVTAIQNGITACNATSDTQENQIMQEKQEKTAKTRKKTLPLTLLFIILGLAIIVLCGDLVTNSATQLALKCGISEIIVGLTIVALGTSLPELVTSIIAAKRKENEIALGNVIGSNIFNVFFVLGCAGIFAPLQVSADAFIDICIVFVLFVIFLIYCLFNKNLKKKTGFVMIMLYLAYLAYIILREFVL